MLKKPVNREGWNEEEKERYKHRCVTILERTDHRELERTKKVRYSWRER